MAPDINALAEFQTDGYATNGVDRNPKYEIPDIVAHAPSVRKIRILSIGAGVTGIVSSAASTLHQPVRFATPTLY